MEHFDNYKAAFIAAAKVEGLTYTQCSMLANYLLSVKALPSEEICLEGFRTSIVSYFDTTYLDAEIAADCICNAVRKHFDNQRFADCVIKLVKFAQSHLVLR